MEALAAARSRLQPALEARGAELAQFAALAQAAARSGELPDWSAVPREVLATGAAATALALALLVPRGRRLVLGTLDTLAATALCLLLLACLLSIPVGGVYLLLRAASLAVGFAVDTGLPALARAVPGMPALLQSD
ncbi:hypothetical protein Rsub_11591 [Raphidocelis subcapitata]|uniref:Uncharacterized protein n=1 Tax=Raphidocelis subcapitata TaxID=307507 RepID=A0A2V0PGE1_9CHLO|nr:hypothetical protein Rsub_11591 [Raphidocelis subcapitata]|eukprot:GBF98826.1 hypothetical protein Rsub_11591 [Raphidocelis subcapitata]